MSSPPRIVITGRPGVGKTTLFKNIVNEIKRKGYTIAGICAPEVREHGVRIGFKIVDLYSGEEAWLARRGTYSPIRIGKYGVLINEALSLWKKALRNMEKAHVICIDEVGPMELRIPGFKDSLLNKVLSSSKPSVLVVHYRLRDPDILRALSNAWRIDVRMDNRDRLNIEVPPKVVELIKKYYGRVK